LDPNTNVLRDTVYLEETPAATTFVESISILNPGFGYTSTPIVTILGDGTGATARATVVNGQVSSITVTSGGINYSQAIIQITSVDGNGSLASGVAVLAGNKGTLRTYYFDNNVKRILNANAGTVEYDTGIVTLTDFIVSAVNNPLGILSIEAVPTSTIISSGRDKIITLDTTDPNAINVDVIAKV
jgi:CBS domain-containing protein